MRVATPRVEPRRRDRRAVRARQPQPPAAGTDAPQGAVLESAPESPPAVAGTAPVRRAWVPWQRRSPRPQRATSRFRGRRAADRPRRLHQQASAAPAMSSSEHCTGRPHLAVAGTPVADAPSAPGQRNSPHPSRLPRLKRGSCAPDIDRPYATPFAGVDPCTLPDDFAGWPRGVGQAAGSTRVDHVHRAPEMDLCPGGPASDGCPVGSLRRRAPVQGPAGIEARPFD